MCVHVSENKVNIQIISLLLKMNNSQMASEGGGGKFIATRVTHAGCLAGEKEQVFTACINNISPANKKDPCPIHF